MNCSQFTQMVSLYLDNELNETEIKEFEIHLNNCEKCKSEYEEMLFLTNILRDCEEVELPDDYGDRFRQKLELEKSKKTKNFNFKAISTIAASLVIVVTSIGLFINNSNDKLDMASESNKMEVMLSDENGISEDEIALDESSNDSILAKEDSASKGIRNAIFTLTTMTTEKIAINYNINGAMNSVDEVSSLLSLIETNEGIIESKTEQSDSCIISIKVPTYLVNEKIDVIKEYVKVDSINNENVDITNEYQKMQDELLKLNEKKLELQKKLSEKSDDTLKNEYESIKKEIIKLEEDQNYYDDMLMYSKIKLDIKLLKIK